MDVATLLRLTGSALGTIGGVLLFLEFFQHPDYINYDEMSENYMFESFPKDVNEYTSLGRVGALFVALGFALFFVATLAG